MTLHDEMAYLDDFAGVIDTLDPEQVGAEYERYTAFCQRLREWQDKMKAAFIEYIDSHGDIPIQTADGPRRVYAAADVQTKCRDAKATFRAVLESSGPDAVERLLTAQPFKHGAARPILEGEWDKHFEVIEQKKLAEGSAKRSLRVTREGDDE